MKKIMNIFAMLGIILFSMGLFFKFFHWGGAPLILLASGFLLVIFFLPSYGYNLCFELCGRRSKVLPVFGAITFCFVGLAILFKLNHWPFAGLMLLLENVFGGMILIPWLLVCRLKIAENGKQKAALISGHISLSLLIMGMLFKIVHWPGGALLLIAGTSLALFVYLPVTLSRFNKEETLSILRNRMGLIAMISFLAFMIYGTGASNTILHSFISLEESIKESEVGPVKKSEFLYMAFNELRKNEPGNKNSELQYTKAMKVKELSDALYNDIEKLKAYLISRVDDVPEEIPVRKISTIDQKDNYDAPSNILIGDPENPNKGAFSGAELKAKINVYREDMLSMYPNNILRRNAENTIGLITPEYVNKEENYQLSWEVNNFNRKPIVAVITYLSKLQLDVRNTEVATIETLYNLSLNAGIPAEEVKK